MLYQNVPSHYETLNVAQSAPLDTIKKAYRRQARQCHPDMLAHNDHAAQRAAEEHFKRVTHAFTVLSNPSKRKEYDLTYTPTKFAPDKRATNTGEAYVTPIATESRTRRDEAYLRYAWDAFISRPFEWSEKSLRFYQRWEWVAALVSLAILWMVVSGQITGLNVLEFVFTTRSTPHVASDLPVQSMLLGIAAAGILTASTYLHARLTHRHSYRRHRPFKRQLNKLTNNLFMGSVILFSSSGLLLGHYLF